MLICAATTFRRAACHASLPRHRHAAAASPRRMPLRLPPNIDLRAATRLRAAPISHAFDCATDYLRATLLPRTSITHRIDLMPRRHRLSSRRRHAALPVLVDLITECLIVDLITPLLIARHYAPLPPSI